MDEPSDAVDFEPIRLYSYGSDPSRDEDAEYVRAYEDERDEIYALVDRLSRRDYDGIGGAGGDSLEWIQLAVDGISAIALLLQAPSAMSKVAATLRTIAERIKGAGTGTWRLNKTAMIVECCEYVRAAVGSQRYGVEVGQIRAVLFSDKSIESVYPEGPHLITVPNIPTDETFVFVVEPEFTLKLLARIPGRPGRTSW